MKMQSENLPVRAALIVAHPGHELRVFHWFESVRPTVFVITDGSGRSGHSRLASTTLLLNSVAAKPGSFYGRFTDLEIYEAILRGDSDLFVTLSHELARFICANDIELVAGDALEGYNPTHDLCRLIIQTAVQIAGRSSRCHPLSYDFPLLGNPDRTRGKADLRIELDDNAFARKIAAARSYEGLESEVTNAIFFTPVDAFRIECLRFVGDTDINIESNGKPFYEQYGEQQVEAGFYRDVVRLKDHILPLRDALRSSIDEQV
jgi:hypothetical protein